MTDKQYKLVESYKAKELELLVSNLLEKGWELCGPLVAAGTTLIQPMILEEAKEITFFNGGKNA